MLSALPATVLTLFGKGWSATVLRPRQLHILLDKPVDTVFACFNQWAAALGPLRPAENEPGKVGLKNAKADGDADLVKAPTIARNRLVDEGPGNRRLNVADCLARSVA